MEKSKLIESLAMEMGMGSINDTKYGVDRYDPDTGTLYAQGALVSKNTITDAKNYLKQQIATYQSRVKSGIKQASDMATIYQIALTGVEFLQQEGEKAGHEIIIEKHNF